MGFPGRNAPRFEPAAGNWVGTDDTTEGGTMALQTTYFLADVDGVLCVAARMTDWSEPRYIVNHWPTGVRTHDFCRYYEVAADALRTAAKVKQSTPGEFWVEVGGSGVFGQGRYLQLVNGGRTQSVRTTTEPVTPLKVGKGTKVEWRDGRWHKCSPAGKWTTVEV